MRYTLYSFNEFVREILFNSVRTRIQILYNFVCLFFSSIILRWLKRVAELDEAMLAVDRLASLGYSIWLIFFRK